MLTSTPYCVLPVVALDGRSIGNGRPGTAFAKIIAAWSESVGIDVIGQARRCDAY
ncbi:MAG: hypothetical protein QM811_20580 [Pirellulales bacterium]